MAIIRRTELNGVYIIEPTVHKDDRGEFFETYNENEYEKNGMIAKFVQDDVSISYKGVLKGFHGDEGTYKLVQCLVGEVFAVVVNCDEESKDFGRSQTFVLSEKNKCQLYIPPMYGNGYCVMSDMAVYSYKQSTYYGDYKQFTYKWDDARFAIEWPKMDYIISERDRNATV